MFSQSLTQQKIYDELVKQDVWFPEIVLKQAIIETNCGKTGSGKNNNIFGFRGRNGYKHYKNWKLSISDYKKWQEKNFCKHLELHHKDSECNYYHFLCYIGFKDGKQCSEKGKKYVKIVESIKTFKD